MSPSMSSWASQQLKKINGKDDLTLLEFCMSLTDASEIRQYLAAYLGSTPEVGSGMMSRACFSTLEQSSVAACYGNVDGRKSIEDFEGHGAWQG